MGVNLDSSFCFKRQKYLKIDRQNAFKILQLICGLKTKVENLSCSMNIILVNVIQDTASEASLPQYSLELYSNLITLVVSVLEEDKEIYATVLNR